MADPKASLPPEVLAALSRGNLIEAIKQLRKSGIGIAEAKAIIDAAMVVDAAKRKGTAARKEIAQHKAEALQTTIRDSKLSPGEEPRTKSGAGLMLGIIAAAILAWIYWIFR